MEPLPKSHRAKAPFKLQCFCALTFLVCNFCASCIDNVTGIRLEPASTVLTAGETVRCTADGYPPPRYRWIRLQDNVEVSSSDTLQVNESADDHTYMCVASNTVVDLETRLFSQHVYFKADSRPVFLSTRLMYLSFMT